MQGVPSGARRGEFVLARGISAIAMKMFGDNRKFRAEFRRDLSFGKTGLKVIA